LLIVLKYINFKRIQAPALKKITNIILNPTGQINLGQWDVGSGISVLWFFYFYFLFSEFSQNLRPPCQINYKEKTTLVI